MAITLRPEVAAFAELMELTLRRNDHKPSWRADSAGQLLARLHDEVSELSACVECCAAHDLSAVSEAVDVANFAMMIADVLGGLAQPKPAPDTNDHRKLVRSVLEAAKQWRSHHPPEDVRDYYGELEVASFELLAYEREHPEYATTLPAPPG